MSTKGALTESRDTSVTNVSLTKVTDPNECSYVSSYRSSLLTTGLSLSRLHFPGLLNAKGNMSNEKSAFGFLYVSL